jgi:hypothetical protein
MHVRSAEQRSACQDLFRKILPEDSDVSNKTLKHELAKVGVPITVRGCTHVCSCVHARTRVSTEPEKVGTAISVRSLWLADSHRQSALQAEIKRWTQTNKQAVACGGARVNR